ncbi:MAG: ComEC/Rec2 family competence protein [Bacteroidota bacterium]
MKSSIKKTPFIRLVIPLIIGIMAEYYLTIPLVFLKNTAIGLICLIALHHLIPLKWKYFTETYYGTALTLTFICLGAFLYNSHYAGYPEVKKEQELKIAEIINIPEEKENSYETVIKLKAVQKDSSWQEQNAHILTYFAKPDSSNHTLKPGDVILFNSYVNPIQNQGNPYEFDYKKYLSIHGIYYQTYIGEDQYKKINFPGQPSILSISNQTRLYLLSQLKNAGLKNQELAICSALTLGHKDLLNARTKDNFSNSGAMHILAVSGLHVGIIFLIFHYLLLFMEKTKSGRFAKTILIILILGGYAFLTGLTPSVTRATLMFIIIAIGKISRQNTSIYNNLAFSAFILLLFNPMILFSVGFQLSYTAVASIVFFQPKIYQLLTLPLIADKLWQWFTVALAAQIGTAPLIIYYFHQFPNYFWLTNFIAIPAASLIIIQGLLIFITSPILPIISQATGFLLKQTTATLNFLLNKIQNLPMSVSHNLYLEQNVIFMVYILIGLTTIFLLKKKTKALILAFSVMIVVLFLDIYRTSLNSKNSEFVIYNIRNKSVYNYISNKKNIILSNNKEIENEELQFSAKNLWLKRNVSAPDIINSTKNTEKQIENLWMKKNFFSIHGKRFCIITNNKYRKLSSREKLKIDYLIISNDANVKIASLQKLFDFKQIIIDSSNSFYKREQWIKKLEKQNIPYHSVAEDGAFHIRFS